MIAATSTIPSIRQKLERNIPITREDVLGLAALEGPDLMDLFALANRVRARLGDVVDLCSITNAKCGLCSEDCSFCAQSIHYNTNITPHPHLSAGELLETARLMQECGASRFCIVMSGKSVDNSELGVILDAVKMIKRETNLSICASLGVLTREYTGKLKEAGVLCIHHNLETSERFFRNVCTTHPYEDRLKTIRIAKEHGVEVCCGGIIGLGESVDDRIDLAFTLRDLDVDSIPINILNPIAGTPLEDTRALEIMDILKTIAIFRLILPDKNIRIAGGREKNLRDFQALGLLCGANGLLLGNYLTTEGRSPADDLQMIQDLGLSFDQNYMNKQTTTR